MRAILATLLVAVALNISAVAPASSSVATPTYVQGAATYATGSATTIARAYTSNVTAGNVLMVSAAWTDTGSISATCTDSRGNTFYVATTVYQSAASQSLKTCYAINATTGADTVTVTLSTATTFRGLTVDEYTGVAAGNPVDITQNNKGSVGTTTDAMTTNSVTTTATSGELIYGAFFGQTSAVAGTGFTQRSNSSRIVSEDELQGAVGAVSATATQSTSGNYQAILVALRPLATGPAAMSVIGQSSYTANSSGTTNSLFYSPEQIRSITSASRLLTRWATCLQL